MSDPYAILGLDSNADGPAIRQRYLALVRQFTPDQAPERFAEIHSAYEQLSCVANRLTRQLFETKTNDSLDVVLADARSRLLEKRILAGVLFSLIKT